MKKWTPPMGWIELDGFKKHIGKFFRVDSNQRVKPETKTDKTAKIIWECEGNALKMQMLLERHIAFRLQRAMRDWDKDYGCTRSKLTYKLIEEEN